MKMHLIVFSFQKGVEIVYIHAYNIVLKKHETIPNFEGIHEIILGGFLF